MNSTHLTLEKGKTILVSGGCGYFGSQVIRSLASEPAFEDVTIRIFDNMQSGSYQALMDLPERGNFQFFEGDILDPAALRVALNDVDWVVHLAAIVRAPLNYEHFAWTLQVNQWGTTQLVEACIQAQAKHLVFASSTAVYGPGGPYTEEDVCRPLGSYAQSKLLAEANVQSATERGLPSTILRFGTLYGYAPVIHFDTVANRFAILAGTRRSLTVHGNGKQQRPLIHVRDASDAIAYCLSHFNLCMGKVFNAHDQNYSVLDLVEIFQSLDPTIRVRYTDQDILTHLSFNISNEKIMKAGWKPKIFLRDGLEELLNHLPNIKSYPEYQEVDPDDLLNFSSSS